MWLSLSFNNNDVIGHIFKNEMMEIEQLFINDMALQSMNGNNMLRQYDVLWHYQNIISVKVVNDAAP